MITSVVSTYEFVRSDVIDRWKLDFAIIMTGPIRRATTRCIGGDQYLSKAYKYTELRK